MADLSVLDLYSYCQPKYPRRHFIPGVDSDGLLDNQTILNQLSDVLPGVGITDLADLIRIQPNLEIRILTA